MPTPSVIAASGSFALGERTIHRLGFGAMRITGAGVWGPPRDPGECQRVLRRALELGVDFIDTADSYGPAISEELIRSALHPYPAQLVIATKAGLLRTGPDRWVPCGRPDYLRQQCELSLRRLGLERIELFQLHRIDASVPADDQFGLLRDLVAEGKVRHIGLSEVTVAEITRASRLVTVVSVQNRFNLIDRGAEPVLAHCAAHGIGFVPWYPLASGQLSRTGSVLDRLAHASGHTPSQLALAWLLRRSPVMLPIPGTATVDHLEQNCAAAAIQLSDQQFADLEHAGARA